MRQGRGQEVLVRRFVVLCGVVLLSLGVSAAWAQPAVSKEAARCAGLASVDLSHTPDAIIQVLSAQAVEGKDGQGGYCEVNGYVAPSVGFALRLPSEGWNGKFIELGCAGACGITLHVVACAEPLRRGYACIVTDGGHKSLTGDVKWAYNDPQAVVDYFVRASHVTAIAGKAIVEHYYEQAPQKSYFMGCSAGGSQAMMEAQRFPWDFDGIIAGAPSLSMSEIVLNLVWNNRALTGPDGEPILGKPDIETLHKAVVGSCDLNDGVKDGLIGDPRTCGFDPAQLLCRAGKSGGCLTSAQVAAVKKIYGGPVTSTGEQIVRPAARRGSELTWIEFLSGSAVKPNPMYQYMGEWFRYYLFEPNPGPSWKLGDFDFDRDYKRMGVAEAIEATNPDLRRFKARGGKLISYSGWGDPGGGGVFEYYEMTEKVMGGRPATQDFYRLFAAPGMHHCGAGEGASSVDWLSHLEAWVEKGQAPDKIIGMRLKSDAASTSALSGNPFAIAPPDPAQAEFSRPIYPYPAVAKYGGRGDPKDAASFRPVHP